MAHILIKTLVFAPDGVSTATLVSKLAKVLQAKGHTISVITAAPHYNFEAEARDKQPLARHLGGLYYTSNYHGINVWHTSIVQRNKDIKSRFLGFFMLHIIGFFIALLRIHKIDVVFVVSPPLTSGIIGWMISAIKQAKLIYNAQELYPDIYIQLGSLQQTSWIARILFAIEQFVYNRSDAISVISNMFKTQVENKGISPSKVHVIPNFVDVDYLTPMTKDNPFARELNLVDKFVVLYAGNLGMTQSFDTLVEVAKRLQHHNDIRFLIVGNGVRRYEIEELINKRKLDNVILQPYQPASRVPAIYGTGDLGLVSLVKGTAKTTLPSKIYTIMSTETALLIAVDLDSDIVRIVEQAQSGFCVTPDDSDALETAILQAYTDKKQTEAYGKNGRRFVVEHNSRQVIVAQYNTLITKLLKEV